MNIGELLLVLTPYLQQHEQLLEVDLSNNFPDLN